ncbi:zinc finger, CCHC-type containing protein [Tanacetum coccineum]
MKVDGIIDKFKARLVIRGFRLEEGIDYFDTYAPVARITTIRLLLALAAIHNLVIHQMDVKRAFLDGNLEEEVYMKQPKGFVMPGNEHKLCKLVKSLYGLKQAPKQWHQKFDEVVLSSGFLLNQSDKCVYSKFYGSGKPVDQLDYSRAIGCLMYAMTSTRPDIAYALEGYSNASWINHVEDSSATSGWVFMLGRGAISWASKKQTCITSSTIEYEFVALLLLGSSGLRPLARVPLPERHIKFLAPLPGRKSGARLSGGHFIGRLAHHFGLVSDDGLSGLSVVARELLLIDMIDEGVQADPAPIQVPQQPPPPPLAVESSLADIMKEISTDIGGEFTNMEIVKCWGLETSRRLLNTFLLNKLNMENLPSKYQGSFSF